MDSAVQEQIDFLDKGYRENASETEFNVLHLYPGELAVGAGFVDSKFFELIGFNTDRRTKKNLGTHDGIRFNRLGVTQVQLVRIFADGSTLIRLRKPVVVGAGYQEVELP